MELFGRVLTANEMINMIRANACKNPDGDLIYQAAYELVTEYGLKEAMYREVQKSYLMQDAESHVDEMYVRGDIDHEYNKEDFVALANRFLEENDCNVAENDLWENIIHSYEHELDVKDGKGVIRPDYETSCLSDVEDAVCNRLDEMADINEAAHYTDYDAYKIAVRCMEDYPDGMNQQELDAAIYEYGAEREWEEPGR